MSQYTLYDPEGKLSPLFPLQHTAIAAIDQVPQSGEIIAVEDAHLEHLIERCRGRIVALFVTTKRSAHEFRALKKESHFVLETPIEADEVAALCALLSGDVVKSDLDMSSMLPADLLAQYAKSIYDKIEEVEALITLMEGRVPAKEELEALRNSVHKFAGNAASYGYIAATPLCRAHEHFLEQCYAKPDHPGLQEKNRLFLRKFRLVMQKLNLKAIEDDAQTPHL